MEQNFAESQRRIDAGDISAHDAWRHGNSHAAYGWGCKPPTQWREELRTAYVTGWKSYHETVKDGTQC